LAPIFAVVNLQENHEAELKVQLYIHALV
jgi:hypothetical protein